MNVIDPLWLTAGVAAGGLHAAALWRDARHLAVSRPAAGPARRMAVLAGAVAAGLAGSLLPAAAGWAVGFAAGAATIFWRSCKP